MKAVTARKPHATLLKPLAIFSAPRLGPIVNSSMISMGAASEPARSSKAVSAASTVVMRPEIWTRPPEISERITGAVTTSPLPFSNSRIAMRLPTLSRVTSLKMRAPLASSVRCTAASWVWLSKPGCASVRLSPVKITCFFTITACPLRSRKRSLPNGTALVPDSAPRASADSSTMRTSSVAVRPRMSLALAVSCTPGSCTTMRSRPCCWITGSDTPSSLMRLCKVVMFCLSAWSCTDRADTGLIDAVSLNSVPSGASIRSRSENWSWITRFAASSVAMSRNLISINWPLRAMPLCRTFFSRNAVRISPDRDSAFLVNAACMSTCSMKCTPPRRSSPKYMGAAPSDDSQAGERESRLSATT